MSAPLVVNTVDGAVWTRRDGSRDGEALYAPEKCGACPQFVMVTLTELAELGIVGSADVLPVPVLPEPLSSERDCLRAAFVEALDNAHHTHPCPEYGKPYWTGCVHYDEAGRVSGVGSCHNGRRADAVLAVRDAEVESLRARVAELEAERAKYVGREPTIAEEMAYLSRCIDSVLDLCDAAEAKGITSGGPFTVEAVRKAADGLVERRAYPPALPWAQLMDDEDLREFLGDLGGAVLDYYRSEPSVPDREVLISIEKVFAEWRLIAEAQHGHNTAPGPDAVTRVFSPVASLREPEGEHYQHVHHSYRVGHDLPETGGEGRG
ncbi:hypothetical protein [Streptomyces sp. NPDC012510]|uniref:hypothetical protein n=1 Tax=Streptomyces sp. NPDC012510 TaxID=3364838 RepID=UPI0036EDD8E6